MELKSLRTELHRLTALVEGWSGPDEIPAVERDLALEKLRTLYEMLRFGDTAPAADGEAEQVPLPVAIDLGEMLSLGALSDEEIAGDEPQAADDEREVADTPGAGAPVPDEPFSAETVADGLPLTATAGEYPGDEPVAEDAVADGFAADEPAAGEPEAPFAELEAPIAEPETPFMEEPEEKEPVAEETPDWRELAVPVAEESAAPLAEEPLAEYPAAEAEESGNPQTGELTPADPAPAEEPVAEPAGAPGENPAAANSAPDPGPASEPAPMSATAASSVYAAEIVSARTSSARVAPTLFGLEEPIVRHRHKQRVIMSLYDYDTTSQSASPRPAQPVVPEPAPAPAVEEAPAARTTPADAAAESDDDVFSVVDISVAPDTQAAPEAASPAAAREPENASAPKAGEPEPAAEPAGDDSAAIPTPESAPRSGAVLGEVINHDVQTLADTIAPPRDIASELRRSEPVTDLRRAIGINDKFLMIRDLFGGDGASYEIAIRALNAFDNLDDCMIYIAEHYAWNANSDGAKLLMELLERKFA